MNTHIHTHHPRALSRLLPAAACLLAVLLSSLLSSTLPAQGVSRMGSLAGEVSDKNTGALLTAATVEIPKLGQRTATDNTGGYSFIGLPEGEYEVVVSYPGLETQRQRVTITAGQWARASFDLGSSDVVQLERFTVMGEREGQAAAIAQQQKADNLINVISTDAYGNIADGNIGNFLRLLPGIATLTGDGEITGITLRGAPPGMNQVTVNGVTMTDGNDNRSPNLGTIPAELVKQVEVAKAITPEMDADAIGGSVNMVTRSGFDYKKAYRNYRATLTQNTYRDNSPWMPLFTFTALDTFLNRKLALTFVGSYANSVNTADRLQLRHPSEDGQPHTSWIRFYDYYMERRRIGVNLKAEYRFDRTAQVHFSINHTYSLTDTSLYSPLIRTRRENVVADYNYTNASGTVISRALIEAGTSPRDSEGNLAGIAPGATDTFTEIIGAEIQNTVGYNNVVQRQYLFDAGGKKSWGALEATARVTFNPTKRNGRHYNFTTLRQTPLFGYSVDTSAGMDKPVITQTYGKTIHAGADMADYETSVLSTPRNVRDNAATAQVDFKRAYSHWKTPAVFSAGIKARWQNYKSDLGANTLRWYYAGTDGVRNTGDEHLERFFDGGGYRIFNGVGPAFDRMNIQAFVNMVDDPEILEREFAPSDAANDIRGVPMSRMRENVYAGYVQARVLVLPNLVALGGLRVESTAIDGSGAFVDSTATDYTLITKTGSYTNLFPGLHLRYNLTPNLQLRSSYTSAIARPVLSKIIPTTTVAFDLEEDGFVVRQNNPNLRPQYAQNYDLMVEWYLKPSGVLSIGWFYKDIKDFIAVERRTIDAGPDNGFGGDYAGSILVTDINYTSATIQGFEINYQQRLTFLPRPFNTLSAFANYTKLKTKGTYNDGITDLANFVPEVVSAGLDWSYRRLKVGVKYNYRGDYLAALGATPPDTVRWRPNGTWDASLSCDVRRSWLQLFFNIVNIGNNWPDGYAINPKWIDIKEYYGTRITFGITGRF